MALQAIKVHSLNIRRRRRRIYLSSK